MFEKSQRIFPKDKSCTLAYRQALKCRKVCGTSSQTHPSKERGRFDFEENLIDFFTE